VSGYVISLLPESRLAFLGGENFEVGVSGGDDCSPCFSENGASPCARLGMKDD